MLNKKAEELTKGLQIHLTDKERKLVKIVRELAKGEARIVVQNKAPVMVETIRDLRLAEAPRRVNKQGKE